MRWLSGARRVVPVLLLAAVVVLLAAGPAAAAAPAGEEKGGLSFLQLHRYDLGIFTLIVFGLLVLILSKTAWPKISEGLAKREASIQGAKDEAQALRREAEEIRAKLQKDYADAADKIRAMMDEARKDADTLRGTEREAGAKEAAAERERAKREIEAAKDAALKDIYQQAVDLAALMSSKALGRSVTAADHARLLDESLAELKHSVKA